jgi:hypothetical protein
MNQPRIQITGTNAAHRETKQNKKLRELSGIGSFVIWVERNRA